MSARPKTAMTAGTEQATAQRIMNLEGEVFAILRELECCKVVLGGPLRQGRTRAAAGERLATALAATPVTPEEGASLKVARGKWAEVQELQGRLAMSAMSVAVEEARRFRRLGDATHADLLQEGYVGLLWASRRYEPGFGTRFSTYARWWVRAFIRRALSATRLIRLPASARDLLRALRERIRACEMSGKPCSPPDLAAEFEVDVERVRAVLAAGATRELHDSEDDEFLALVSELPDEFAQSPEEVCAAAEERRRVDAALANLTGRDRDIVTRHYGLEGESVCVAEIARTLDLSKERVRQLERRSITMLRASMRRDGSATNAA